MKFSEKHGYSQTRSVAQLESMDDALRTGLWNVTYMRYFESHDRFHYASGINIARVIWAGHLHRDLVSLPDNHYTASEVFRGLFLHSEWYEVYDLTQAIVQANPDQDLIEGYNAVMEIHLAGYRIVDDEITPLTDVEEIAEVESALTASARFDGARHHLRNALTLYSRMEKPDYANSIKESISAVESVARELTGKPTLGPALDQFKRDNPDIHSGLISGWKNLYGYTSDEDAIRHGGAKAPDVSQDLARYFLITCSAMVNFLIAQPK